MSNLEQDEDGDGVGLIFVLGAGVLLVAMIVLYALGVCK